MNIKGMVRDAADGTPLPGAMIRLNIEKDELAEIPSDDKGEFAFYREASYIGEILTCKVKKEKYQTATVTHKIEQDEVDLGIIKLLGEVLPPEEIKVRFNIKDEKGNPLEDVKITLQVEVEQVRLGRTDKTGLFEAALRPDLEGKTLNYEAELVSYELVTGQVKLEKETSCQITMKKVPIIIKKVPKFGEIWLWLGGFIAVESIIWGPVGGAQGETSFFVNNVALIPLTTSALAFFRPINWKYAVLYAAVLQAIASFGCILGVGYRHLGEALLALSLAFIGNVVLCGIISLLRQRRLRRRLEQSDT